jgi:multidrug efflux system outer membrane protein
VRRGLLLGAAVLSVSGALAGCTLEPRYVRPQPAIPQSWPAGPAYPQAQAAPALPALSYRDLFKDPRLQALIDRSLADNQNLRAALANVEIARAQYRVQRADLFPHVDAGATYAQTHARSTLGGTTPVGEARTTRDYTANLSVTAFELDLFGRVRSLTHAALEQYLASEAGARAARLTLVSEVADAWLTLAADRSQLAISADTVASATSTVALTRARLEGGVAPRTDLTQAETLLEQARSDQAQLVTQVAQDRNALELLVGGPVADDLLPASLEEVEGRLAQAPAGLDSHILLRRPDVVEAEHNLRAANAQIGAARAAFFPTISLTGLGGYANPALSGLFNHGNATWQAQGAASLPIFAGGANLANLGLARGERDLAVANYQNAIQSAFRDVANALARQGTIREQVTAQEALYAAAQASYELSIARYRQGVDPYLNALITQRTLYSARQTLTDARLSRAANLVALYEAVGGDPVIDAMPAVLPASAPK